MKEEDDSLILFKSREEKWLEKEVNHIGIEIGFRPPNMPTFSALNRTILEFKFFCVMNYEL